MLGGKQNHHLGWPSLIITKKKYNNFWHFFHSISFAYQKNILFHQSSQVPCPETTFSAYVLEFLWGMLLILERRGGMLPHEALKCLKSKIYKKKSIKNINIINIYYKETLQGSTSCFWFFLAKAVSMRTSTSCLQVEGVQLAVVKPARKNGGKQQCMNTAFYTAFSVWIYRDLPPTGGKWRFTWIPYQKSKHMM